MSEIKEGFTRISTISGAFAGYGSIPKAILDKAAARGTCVHKLIKSYTNDVPISDEDMFFEGQPLVGYLNAFKNFWESYEKSVILLQEERIDDDELMITGEPDLVVEHEGKLVLIDWKATLSVGKHWQIQAEGYSYLLSMIKDIPIQKILFVRLDKAGGAPEVVEYQPDWENVFKPAYRLYKMFMQDQKCNLELE
jgi:hypothetical protein